MRAAASASGHSSRFGTHRRILSLCKKPPRLSLPCRGFTLVELLVVVGVISLLLALLLPAMGKARAHAQRMKCAANLRSIGQAMTAYVQQFGYYPCYKLAGGNPQMVNVTLWPAQVRLFMPRGEDVFYCPAQDERCNWWRPGADPPPGHPGARAGEFETNFGYELGELLISGEGGYFSYGYNLQGAGPFEAFDFNKGLGSVILRWKLNEAGTGGRRASRVKVASDMIAVADSNADGRWDPAISPLPDATFMLPGRVHGGGANVLFCDGHVAWYPQKDLVLSPEEYSTPDAPKKRMWNFDHEP
jgi:prepilin-type processing-associated H-X9-DG protein/prepilin-type N-terminal cleavage/methylation domain-containing protein